MDNEHDLVSKLKELYAELGKVPSSSEFYSRYNSQNKIAKLGGYSILLQMAGLPTYSERRNPKITNAIFETSISHQLEQYEPKQIPECHEKWERTLFIGDVHHPFCLWRVIEKACRFAEREKPSRIVQGGDLYDMFSHQKFPRSHNIFTPREEHELARKHAERMWSELKRAAPQAKRHQLWGNHDVRPLKRILEALPSAEDWIDRMMREMMTFDGVELQKDYREELLLPGNVAVHHGYKSQLGQHRDYMLRNAVAFHTHRGGVSFKQIQNVVLWELNGGYVADPAAKGLTYTPQRIIDWTPGFGWLDEDGPRFIPA